MRKVLFILALCLTAVPGGEAKIPLPSDAAKYVAECDDAILKARKALMVNLNKSMVKATKAGDLDAANAIKTKVTEVEALVSDGKDLLGNAAGNANNFCVIDITGLEVGEFRNQAVLFTNRGYVWENIPPALAELSCIKQTGGSASDYSVKVLQSGIIHLAALPTNAEALQKQGWEDTGIQVSSSDKGHTKLSLFRKMVASGVVQIPAQSMGWQGAFVVAKIQAH